MATFNVEIRQRVSGLFADIVYPKANWNNIDNKPATYPPTAHYHNEMIYYVAGNTSGTAGTWTGTISGLAAYYDGLTIRFRIGIAGASTTTLNINGLGAVTVQRYVGSSNITTHFPVNAVITMTKVGSSWVVQDWFDSTDDYGMRWINSTIAGAEVTRYKIIMEGPDRKFYPLTIGNTQATSKTVSTQDFLLNGLILQQGYDATYAANGQLPSYGLWSQRYFTTTDWTFNQVSGWTAYYPVYLKGTIQSNDTFRLDNTTTTSWLTQTLPTTDDGFVYIKLGYMNNTTTAFTLTIDHPIYHYKNGALREYISGHQHVVADITDFPSSLPASDVYAWAKEASKPSYNANEIGGLGASYRWLTDSYISTWNAKQDALGFTAVPNTRTINAKPLNADVTITASDIGAVPNSQTANRALIVDGLGSVITETYANFKSLLAITKTDVALNNLTNDTQMKKIASSTNGKVPTWNGTTGDVLNDGYSVSDSVSNEALAANANLVTERDVYYGLCLFNGSAQSRANIIYAPTGAGTARQKLISAGSGAPVWETNPLYYTLASDQSASITTLADATGMTTASLPIGTYKIKLIASYRTAATTTGIKVGAYLSAGAGNVRGLWTGQISSATVATNLTQSFYTIGSSDAAGSNILTTGVSSTSVDHFIGFEAILRVTTAATMRIQIASEVTGSSATLKAGSTLVVERIE